jgi:MFS family permease
MFAVLSTAWVVPAVLGPGLAGFVEHALGWRWVFLGLLPILALAAFISLPALRGVSMGGESDEPGARTLDAVLVAVGAGLVIGGLTAVDQPVVVPVLVVAGIAVLYRPIRRLVPRGTFTVRAGLPAAVFVRGVMTFAFFGTDAFIPLVIQDVRHESVTYTSVVLTVTTLSWTAAAWVQERLIGRFGARAFVRAGFLCILVGIAGVVATLSSSVPVWVVVPSWMLGCVGMGFGYAPLSLVMLKEAEPGREGTASASLNLSDQLGFAFGTGVSGAAVALGESVDWAGATSLRIGGTITALVALTGVVLASRIPRTT